MAFYWNPTTDLDEPQQGSNGSSKVQVAGSSLTASAPTTANVTNSSTTVVAANTGRKGLVIINTGAVNVSFAMDSNAAVAGSGIMLTQYGSWVMDSFTFTTGAINAICTSSSTLSIQEFN